MFYFGLDRYANNGDAQVGFWFFRDAIGTAGGGAFSGKHRQGDLLVLSHFTQGGRVPDVNVYKWVGSGGSDGALDLLVVGRECPLSAPDDPVCAVVNGAEVEAPWWYVPKFGKPGAFPAGSFYEGGINVSRLLPGVECFSSFMAETRSSQSVDAQLKDLAAGPFDTCPPTAAAPPPAPAAPGGPADPAAPALPETGAEPTGALALLGWSMLGAGATARWMATRALRAARIRSRVDGCRAADRRSAPCSTMRSAGLL
jgi:hypothetical protein